MESDVSDPAGLAMLLVAGTGLSGATKKAAMTRPALSWIKSVVQLLFRRARRPIEQRASRPKLAGSGTTVGNCRRVKL